MQPAAILESLATISNEWRWLAVAWHIAVVAVAVEMWRRPATTRTVATWMIAPVVSVSALAWWSGNPFTGALFACLAVVMTLIALPLPVTAIAPADSITAAAGLMLVIFGLVYPHFLRADSWVEYVYAAPFGLVPCPTLAGLAGVSLLTGSFGSRRWAATIATAALIYGVIGAAVLGVWIDAALIAGGAALLATTRPATFHAALAAAPSAPGSVPRE